MLISAKGRYALRCMLDISLNGTEDNVKIKDIAERQDIPLKYLEQIVSTLNKAGFVKGKKGPNGGYRLSRPPEEYTVGMIIKVIEGNTAPVSCLADDCGRSDKCVSMILWKKLDDAVNSVLDGTTLADMMDWSSRGQLIEIEIPDY
ncbi:RrF2 family transcriptional regulator [Candidatus Methanoplasma termitum]|nr:Rrf2 family transcriptional regulator [Candidatus Methanoplasma termitum]MCL2333439.1 Rrf2 family transcriptional regulator [Candidatus Methanoplasma sp.]